MNTVLICPSCGKNIDAHVPVSSTRGEPAEGDATVCFGCATPLVFESDALRHPTAEELSNLLGDKGFVSAITAVRGYLDQHDEPDDELPVDMAVTRATAERLTNASILVTITDHGGAAIVEFSVNKGVPFPGMANVIDALERLTQHLRDES